MSRIRFSIPIMVTTLIVLVLGGLALLPVQARSEKPDWTWMNPLPQDNNLNSVWGSGPNDVFAVGSPVALTRRAPNRAPSEYAVSDNPVVWRPRRGAT